MNVCPKHAPALVDECDVCVAVVRAMAPAAQPIKQAEPPQPARPIKASRRKSLEQARQDVLANARKLAADDGVPEWFTTRSFRRRMKQAARKRGAGWTKAGNRRLTQGE